MSECKNCKYFKKLEIINPNLINPDWGVASKFVGFACDKKSIWHTRNDIYIILELNKEYNELMEEEIDIHIKPLKLDFDNPKMPDLTDREMQILLPLMEDEDIE